MTGLPEPAPDKSRPGLTGRRWSTLSHTLELVFSFLSVATPVYCWITWRRGAVGSQARITQRPPEAASRPNVAAGASPSPAEEKALRTQPPEFNSQTRQVRSTDGPALPRTNAVKEARQAAEASTALAVKRLPDSSRGSRYSAGSTLAILIACLLLLALAQVIFNLAEWFHWNLDFLTKLQPTNCIIPGFCDLRFPPLALFGFLAVWLAAGLFGWRLSQLNLPVLNEITIVNSGQFHLRRLLIRPLAIVAVIFIVCESLVLYQSILGVSVEPAAWAVGLICGWILVWQLTRQPGAGRHEPILWNVAYLAGIFSLCLAAAGFVSRRWLLGSGFSLLTLLLLGADLYRHRRQRSLSQLLVRLALPILTLASFSALSYGLNSWVWSFLGDEYAFYDLAREIAHGKMYANLLSGAGVYGYHPYLSSAWPGITMWLFGEDGYGWRVSHSLVLAISMPLFYYFMKPVIGRGGALAAAALYGTAHVLLSFGKLGSNNGQVIVFMAMSWAAFLWAARRGSQAGFALTGIIIGLAFYTFGVARIYSLLIVLWLALYYFPITWRPLGVRRANAVVWLCVVGMALLTAIPVLSTRSAWSDQLHQTLLYSEIPSTPVDLIIQFIQNALYTFASFLYNNQNAVFVYGALADPITASLMVFGLAAILATWRRGWRIRAGLLSTYVLYATVIGGLQQYNYPSITRMFSVVPFYALFAAVGLAAFWQILTATLGLRQNLIGLGAAVIVAGTAILNIWISVDLSPRHIEQKLPAMELQTAQLTGDANGNGPHIYLIAPPQEEFWINKIFSVHDIPLDRYSLIFPRDALLGNQLCQAGQQSAIAIIPASLPNASYLAGKIGDCWQASVVRLIKDGRGRELMIRVMSQAALSKVRPLPGYWLEEELPRTEWVAAATTSETWRAYAPRGLAVAEDGTVAVAESTTQSILFFDSNGKIKSRLVGVFKEPSDVAYMPDGSLVVLDAGVGAYVLNEQGIIKLQIGGLTSPRGVFATKAGDIYIANTGHGEIVQLDKTGQRVRALSGGDKFAQPTSVAVSASGLIAIGDPVLGRITIFDQNEKIINQISIQPGDTADAKPALLWLPNGNLLYTDAAAGVIHLIDLQGKELHQWTGLQRPNDLAIAPDGKIYLLEAGANRVVTVSLP